VTTTGRDLGGVEPSAPVVQGVDAFEHDSVNADLSKAGQMLAMATLVRGDPTQIEALRSDARELGVPGVGAASRDGVRRMLDVDPHDAMYSTLRNSRDVDAPLRVASTMSSGAVKGGLWRSADNSGDPSDAVALLRTATLPEFEPSDIEQVAASASLFCLGAEEEESRLAEFASSQNPLVAGIASAALGTKPGPATRGPSSLATLTPRAADELSPSGGGSDSTSIAIHGTGDQLNAPDDAWWRPTSELSMLIRSRATPSLYSGDDNFRWTGGYSDLDRDSAARDLITWQRRQGLSRLDTIFAHSHGGNIALSALNDFGSCSLLVLMHTPVLRREAEEWQALASKVGRVLDCRTRMDLVVLADGLRTGSVARLPAVMRQKRIHPPWQLPGAWFSHSFYVEHENWAEYNLVADVVFERYLARYADDGAFSAHK
jgi:hypothetical protein